MDDASALGGTLVGAYGTQPWPVRVVAAKPIADSVVGVATLTPQEFAEKWAKAALGEGGLLPAALRRPVVHDITLGTDRARWKDPRMRPMPLLNYVPPLDGGLAPLVRAVPVVVVVSYASGL